jgi:hypothetical protein
MGGCLAVRLRHIRAEADDGSPQMAVRMAVTWQFPAQGLGGWARKPIHHEDLCGTLGGTRTPNLLIRSQTVPVQTSTTLSVESCPVAASTDRCPVWQQRVPLSPMVLGCSWVASHRPSPHIRKQRE